MLQQQVNGSWQPLGFFSKKLDPTQRNYSAYNRELLAVYAAVKRFRFMLEGRDFFILTDHKPLTFAFRQKAERASPRQCRHLTYISEFTTDIRHVAGSENLIADALSRVDVMVTSISINTEEFNKKFVKSIENVCFRSISLLHQLNICPVNYENSFLHI